MPGLSVAPSLPLQPYPTAADDHDAWRRRRDGAVFAPVDATAGGGVAAAPAGYGAQGSGTARMKGHGLRLDERDLRILAILQREGRITKAELAKRVNLSATPCWARLQRLEEAGIIERYGARIDFKYLAPFTYVFMTIELASHRSEDFARFEAIIDEIPEIFECFAVGGGIDYIIKVMARDIDSYQALVDGILSSDAGVQRYWTYFVTKPVKEEPPPPYPMVEPPE
jgi:Lrp/AsnC family transcriptional regulator, regulator of ectoine-degradation genes